MCESSEPQNWRATANISESQGEDYRLTCRQVPCVDVLQRLLHPRVSLANTATRKADPTGEQIYLTWRISGPQAAVRTLTPPVLQLSFILRQSEQPLYAQCETPLIINGTVK